MDGEVIGVNTAIISPTGGSIGIGFAVPSDTALAVIDQLKQFGETRRGWLGVRIQSVTEDIADTLGVKESSGALVASVTPDSPAGKAGIEAGDVIVKFDGKEVSTMRGLPRLVAQTPIGKTVDVEALRKGEKKSFKVAVGRLVEDEKAAEASPGQDPAPEKPLIGLRLAPLGDELRQKHGIDPKVKGVVVTEVDPQSPAAQKGVKAGDVIVEAGQEQVSSVEDVAKSIDKVRKSGRKAVLLRIEDAKGDLRFVAVPLE
jgi:serine protease Do